MTGAVDSQKMRRWTGFRMNLKRQGSRCSSGRKKFDKDLLFERLEDGEFRAVDATFFFSYTLQYFTFLICWITVRLWISRLDKSASPPWRSRLVLEVLFLWPRLSPPNVARQNHRLYNWSKKESKEMRASFESKPCVRLPILALGRKGELRTTYSKYLPRV